MPNEHLTFAIHTSGTFPAWTVPDKTIPVTSSTFEGARVRNIHQDTGSSIRSRKYSSQGATNVTGSVSMRAYPEYLLPWVFRSFLTDAAQTAASSGWTNHMLPNDSVDVQLPWFSFQEYRSAAVSRNVRGAVLQKITLSGNGGEDLQVAMDFIAEDIGRIGGTWSDGSNTNLSSVISPSYPDPLPPPLRFHEGNMIFDADSVSVSSNEMTVTGGTVVCTIETFSLEITLNTEGRFAICDGAPTIAYTRHGVRDIVLTAEIDWADFAQDYYDDMRAANDSIIRLEFESDGTFPTGQNYKMLITLPRMAWPEDGAPFPQLDGTIMPKKQSLRLVAMENADINYDIGVTFQTLDDLVP